MIAAVQIEDYYGERNPYYHSSGDTIAQINTVYITNQIKTFITFAGHLAVPFNTPFSCNTVTEIPQAECEALVALYNSTSGDTWNNHLNWLETNTPSDWLGVTITSNHVTGIQLETNNLIGVIPPEIGNLLSLVNLDIEGNHLNGSIPMELGNLVNLVDLSLTNNQLTGGIPSQLGNLSSLERLALNINQLSGTIPPELGYLTNLRYLYLNYNELSGSLPIELGQLTNLVDLSLRYNNLSGNIPIELSSFPSLLAFIADNNQLSGSIPYQLGNLNTLIYLELNDNQLIGDIPSELGSLSNLQGLHLENNRLSGNIPVEIGNLTSLAYLFLQNNALEGNIPASITNLVNLIDNVGADLGYNMLTSSDPDVIAFLATKNPEWSSTQTIAPMDFRVTNTYTDALEIAWSPIDYTLDDGYYEVSLGLSEEGPYSVIGVTGDKTTSSYRVDGLINNTRYYLRLRTFTPAHDDQQNDLWSNYTAPVSAFTGESTVLADFIALPTSGIAPVNIAFTNNSTGDYSHCTWFFGDESTSNDCNNPSHTYTGPGVFTVTLTVGGLGGVDTEIKTNLITIYQAVLANFSANLTSGSVPLVVSFTNLSVGDFDTCNWDFGDGDISEECNNPTHLYNQPGLFSVSLTISGLGGVDTEMLANYIATYEPVQADFSAVTTVGRIPLMVTFTNLSTGDFDSCSWEFGDSSISDECMHPTHLYNQPGLFSVSLTITGHGGVDTKIRSDYIKVENQHVIYIPISVR